MKPADRSLVTLVGTGHALVHTYELSLPILVGAWLLEFGTTRATLGIVLTLGYGLFGAGALPAGVLVDRIGPRWMIVGCLGGMAASFAVLGLAWGPWSLAIGLVAWGVAASVYHPSGLTLISTAAAERGTVFAYHGMAGNLGIGLGPLVTALLLVVLDWRLVVAIVALPAAAAAAYAVVAPIESDPEGTGASPGGTGDNGLLDHSALLFSGAFGVIFLLVILSGLYYRGTLTFLPDILSGFEGFEPVTVGDYRLQPNEYFFVAMLMIGMLGQYVGGRLSDRIRPERGIAGVFVALAVIALIFVPVATANLAVFIVVGLALGVFLFMIQPLYQAAVADHSPREARGLSYGFTYLGVFGIGAVGSSIAGIALTYADAQTLFLVFAGLAGLGAIVAVTLVRRTSAVPAATDRNG